MSEAQKNVAIQSVHPKCLVFINHIVFSKASAFEIPSNCLSYKIFISLSVIASAAFGLFPVPSFLSYLLRASNCRDICRLSSAD